MTPTTLWENINKLHWSHWITLGLIITTMLIWIPWDIFVASDDIPGNTETELIRSGGRNSLLVTAACGILISHFFWPNTLWEVNGWTTLFGLMGVGLLWLGIDIHYWVTGNDTWFQNGLQILRKYPIINFQIHTLVGFSIWSTKF